MFKEETIQDAVIDLYMEIKQKLREQSRAVDDEEGGSSRQQADSLSPAVIEEEKQRLL